MKVTNIVNIDLSIRQNIPFVDAVQGDSARAIEFRLFEKGQPFNVPDGSAVLIRYKRPDGFGGVYDTLPNGEIAYSIIANKVTVVLSPTALGVAGSVDFQITVSNGEDLISAFSLEIRVDADPSFDSVDAEDYINISQFVTEESKKNAPYIGDNGNWWVNQEDTGVKAGGGSGGGGADGFSPVAKVAQTDSGATITITDKNGTTTATVTNGKDGKDGAKGETGAQGEPGKDGANGKDGVSATHSWNGTTLTVTSASGTSSANLKGDKGDKGDTGGTGAAGTSVTVKSVSESTADGGSNVVTFSDGKTLTIKNGSKGSTGGKGDTGATGKTAYQYAQDGGYAGTETEFAEKLANEYTLNPLYGKKISLIGDSICAGGSDTYVGGYGKIIADRNNMAYENFAKAGSTITAETYSSTTGNAKGWISRMVDSMSADADYAIVEGGINDAWQYSDHKNIEIGELTTGYNATLDDTTYYGAFESMLKKLVTKFQGKKIGYIAVPKTMGLYDSNRNAPNFYHIALECCAKWGVPVCDLNTIIPPTEYLKTLGTTYTADGTHPTYEGYLKYYCDPIEAWMKTLTTGGSVQTGTLPTDLDDKYVLKNDISIKKAQLTLEDGTTVLIDVVVASEGTTIKKYTNQVPKSIDTDGTVFNGTGYQDGYRLSSSGATKAQAGCVVTGYIPVKAGDVIRIYGCDWATALNSHNYICAYNSSFAFIGANATVNTGTFSLTKYTNNVYANYTLDDNYNITLIVAALTDIAYIRVSSKGNTSGNTATFAPEDMIVTVNEEIT